MKILNKLKKKILLTAAAVFVGGTAIAETQLNFWSWRQEDVEAYNSIIAEFE